MIKANLKRLAVAALLVAWFFVMFHITPSECFTAPGIAVPKHCVD